MQEKVKLKTRPALTGLIVATLILSACSGPGVMTNTPSSSSSTSSPTTPATPLTLQGSPPTSVTAGTLYSFQPTVSPSMTGVTFAITQKPAWANFNSSTGALSGTPSVGNVGMTANIKITASDGSTTASIGPFDVTVDAPAAPPANGTATLTWVAPTENTDGTALVNLAGYHIHYGTEADALTQEVDVAGASSTTYTLSGLAPGTYFFAVTAYSASGTESDDSNVGTKTI